MSKRFLFILAALLAVIGSFQPRRAVADEVSFSFFYDNLNPYGEWIDVAGYGTCWQPNASVMVADWAPYTDGSWAYTDAGWTWVSNEDFGEIVYHYGRWARLDGLGWIWRPDTEWGPAWVSWRSSNDYIGWAPLPPEVHFQASIGISGWVDDTPILGPSSYSFCFVQDFGAPLLRSVLFGRDRNMTIIHSTTNITNISYNSVTKVVYNGGPDYHYISQRSKRRIEKLHLDRRTSVSDYRHGRRAERSRGTLIVHAPRVRKDSGHGPKVRRKWEHAKADHGWKGVNTAERERWEKKIRDEKRHRGSEKGRPERFTPHGKKNDRFRNDSDFRPSDSSKKKDRKKEERRPDLQPWAAPRVKAEKKETGWDKKAEKAQKAHKEARKQAEKRWENARRDESPRQHREARPDRHRDKPEKRSFSQVSQGRDRGKKDEDRGKKDKGRKDRKEDEKRDKKKR